MDRHARSSRDGSSKAPRIDAEPGRHLFTCAFEGCGRSFTRSEHLHRHSLNHTEGEATCPRCRAHFKRKDLLERHLGRHRQKDQEAGGEGHGRLNTRKRMWKDHDGRIVQKKPRGSLSSEPSQERPEPEGPISPPISSENPDIPSDHAATATDPLLFDDVVLSEIDLPSYSFGSTSFDSLWMTQCQQPRAFASNQLDLDLDLDHVFQPDTASSFNMPFTTQVNYNWLFNLDDELEAPVAPVPQAPNMHDMVNSFSAELEQRPDIDAIGAGVPPDARTQGCRQDDAFMVPPPPEPHSSSQLRMTHGDSQGSTPTPSGAANGAAGEATQAHPAPRHPITPAHVDFERPLAFLRRPQSLPTIDEVAYTQVLQTIEAARPSAPDGSVLDVSHPLLSLAAVRTYCDLFFTKFNTAYPLIHQATFDRSRFEPLLMLSIVLLGATYSSKEAHQLAVCIHDVMRPQIFAHAGFNPKPDLWVLQTILLVECFGKSRAGQKQHDMSHLFHGMLINLIRRSDCQSVRPVRLGEVEKRADGGKKASGPRSDDVEVLWRQWAEAEEKKRLALLCFMWDTQHAVLFCQSLCMSAFELRVGLPCDQTLWEAGSGAEWASQARASPPELMYLLALKSYLTPDTEPRPARLNGLSRAIVFHGLMSIFWDMSRRDQTSLGVIPGPSTSTSPTSTAPPWQARLEKAYEAWKADFDGYCATLSAMTEEESDSGAALGELGAWRAGCVAVYHAAHVLLRSDFLDVQIYAGARHILGRPVQRADYVRSERVVRQWVRGRRRKEATMAARHAAELLSSVSATHGVDHDAMGLLFHVPWCLYLATLTIWAWHHVGKKSRGARGDDDDDDDKDDDDDDDGDGGGEMVWDAQAEMGALLEGMLTGEEAHQGPGRTGGLVWVMAGTLSKVRWGIVHAGVAVLRGLVPWRLIGQSE